MIESATWWQDGPEIETGEMRTEDIKTEVFFLPAAAHTEKSGSFTNTQRMLQWHHEAVPPAGDARSDLWFTYHLGRRIRAKLAASGRRPGPAGAGPGLGLPGPRPAGRAVRRGGAGRGQRMGRRREAAGRVRAALRRRVDHLRVLDLRRRVRRRGQPDGPPQARLRAELGRARVGLGLARQPADPVQPGLGRPGRQALERAQGLRLVGRRGGQVDRARRARLPGHPAALLPAPRGRDRGRRDLRNRRVHHAERRQGLAVRARRAWPTGRCPRTTSRRSRRSPTRCTASSATRSGRSSGTRRTRCSPAAPSRARRCSPTWPPPTG